jgi:DNA polymerase I-like protein with 3'-5' exonuclease and polymerase domains
MLRLSRFQNLPHFMFLTERDEVRLVVNEYLRHHELRMKKGKDYGLVMGLDSETTGLHIKHDRISVFSMYTPCPMTIPELGIEDEFVSFVGMGGALGCEDHIREIIPLTTNPHIVKCGANISGFDSFMFENHHVVIEDPMHDTVIMDWLWDENRSGSHGLKQCMYDFYGYKMEDYKSAGRGEMDIRKWDSESALRYPAVDAWASYKVWAFLKAKLQQEPWGAFEGRTLWDYYTEFTVRIQKVLRNMMRRGVRIDMDYLDSIAPDIKKEMNGLEKWFNRDWQQRQFEKDMLYITETEKTQDEARIAKGKEAKFLGKAPRLLNVRSNPQLKFLYFDLMDKPVLKKNTSKKTGKQSPSLNKEVLKEYSDQGCEFSENLLRYRELDNLYGTYVGDKPEDDEEDYSGRSSKGGLRAKVYGGRIYTSFKFGPVTGRLASSNPNLMNIPAKSDLGKQIKQAFVSPLGKSLLCLDYSQLEMRLFAHFAQEEAMINAILSGRDLHCVTASLMMNIPYEEVHIAKLVDDLEWEKLEATYGLVGPQEFTPQMKRLLEYRSIGKTIGFGLLYGAGPNKIGQQIKKTKEEAKGYIEKFFGGYPGAKRWMDDVFRECEDTQVVWTYFQRPRRLNEINSKVDWIKARTMRQAVNSIIQGCKDGETRVLTDAGYKKIKDLCDMDEYRRPAITRSESSPTKDYSVYPTGVQDVYLVRTSLGTEIVTEDHRFFTYRNGGIQTAKLKSLRVSNFIAASRTVPVNKIDTLSGDHHKGYIAAGEPHFSESYHQCSLEFTSGYMNRIIKEKGSVTHKHDKTPVVKIGRIKDGSFALSLQEMLHRLGIYSRIEFARRSKTEESGGYIGCEIVLSPCSLHLLCRVGLLRKDVVSENDVESRRHYGPTDLYLDALATLISCPIYDSPSTPKDPKYRDVAIRHDQARYLKSSDGQSFTVKKGSHNSPRKSYTALRQALNEYNPEPGLKGVTRSDAEIFDLVHRDWAEILGVHYVGKRATYDITIEGERDTDKSYIGGGLIQHNSAVDFVLNAMVKVDEDETLKEKGCELLLQVHDELMLETPEEYADENLERVKSLMEYPVAPNLSVPLTVSAHKGKNWREAK